MRKIALALALILGLANGAAAQAPPPIPALPDSPRITTYSISTSTCACSVGFAIYGQSGTPVDAWIQVYVNGTAYLSTDPTFGWSLSSVSGPLNSIARPITNAVLTFNSAQTGAVVIVGDRRPSRTTQFSENRGVPARDLNQAVTDLQATQRELWDKSNRSIVGQPGEVLLPLPNAAGRAGQNLVFDANGQPSLGGVVGVPAGVLTGNNTWLGVNNFTNTTTFAGGVVNTFGESINITSTCANPPSVRGPLYICNDVPGNNLAGQDSGLQVWIGGNPVATPAANGPIAATFYIDNLNSRSQIWATNTICSQQNLAFGSGAVIGSVHCNEANLVASIPVVTPTSAYTDGSWVHGWEATCNQNAPGAGATPQPCQVAFWAWPVGDYANSSASQFQPFNFGFSATRMQYAGFDCESNPGGASDTGTYFKGGCLWDQTTSGNSTIKVSGTKNAVIDLFDGPSLTYFVRGFNGSATNLTFANSANFNYQMTCQAGASADEECGWYYNTFGATPVWKVVKNSTNNFDVVNIATGHVVTEWQLNDTVKIGAGSGALSVFAGGQVQTGGQLVVGGSAPTITSGLCGTGTNGTIVGNNNTGIITIGAASTTDCQINFNGAPLFFTPTSCLIFPGNAAAAAQGTTLARVGTPTNSLWHITGSALASTVYSYLCI